MSEDELPTEIFPSGVYTKVIPGVCYGESQDCSNETVGYLVFLRSSKKEGKRSTDQINHEQYCSNMFLHYVAKTRQYYLQREGWQAGNPVDDDQAWIGWQVSEDIT